MFFIYVKPKPVVHPVLNQIRLSRESAVPDHLQVARQLEEMIRGKTLAPGLKLPPTSDLVRLWGLNTSRIQRAMSVLVQGGLLERLPRRGTFVPKSIVRPTVGILVGSDLLPESYQFDRALVFALKAELFDAGFVPRVYDGLSAPTSPQARRSQAELEYDLRHVSFLGVISISGFLPKKLPGVRDLPSATFGIPAKEVDVSLDFHDFDERSIQWLAGQGCRRIAAFHYAPEHLPVRYRSAPFGSRPMSANTDDKIRAEVVENLLSAASSPEGQPHSVDRHAYFAMKAVLENWKLQGFRPDGLVFTDDIEVRGAATAILEAYGKRKSPRLITMAFEHSEHFYPLPVARYLCQPSAISEVLIKILLARANREFGIQESLLISGQITASYR